MANSFYKPMSEKSDEQLMKVLTTDRKDYLPEAIEAAEFEFSKRFPNTPLPVPVVEVEPEEQEVMVYLDRTRETSYHEKPQAKEGVHYDRDTAYTMADSLPEDKLMSHEGRISMGMYWSRWLVCFVVNIIAALLLNLQEDLAIMTGFFAYISTTIFMLIQGIKRMHDNNLSGWYLLIPIYNIFLLFSDGSIGPNDYGDDPKGRIPVEE